VQSHVTELAALVRQCETDVSVVAAQLDHGNQLAAIVGIEHSFSWHLVRLRWLIEQQQYAENQENQRTPNSDGDLVRETYSELLDQYRNVPERVAALRKIGERIRFLEDSGALPAAMVARMPRPK
jgi:hypothetical protein